MSPNREYVSLTSLKVRARFGLDKATDRVYFRTQNKTGVETGTGCTVYARNLNSADEQDFLDRAIFNPWKEKDAAN